MSKKFPYRLIISGGGTGGHIFPAISIANAFKERYPDAKILFVGAEGRMEMTRVPEAGYEIIGLWISGLQRRLTVSNLILPFKIISSYFRARRIINDFKPHVVIGTGGYASGPIMLAATGKNIPSLLQEQNSYAGITNKRLGERVKRICVAYPNMDKYFPKKKVVFTGNPVRKDILDIESKRSAAQAHFGLQAHAKTLLILGGSLGAKTINESILSGLDKLVETQIQVIWQTGKIYFNDVQRSVADKDLRNIHVYDFLKQMDLAYACADVVISRAGALSISEISLAQKPCILVPSPNVAEDHQTKNAMALSNEDAAVTIKDAEAGRLLVSEAMKLLYNEPRCAMLKENIGRFGKPDAAEEIVNEIEKLIEG